jgi:hypothetical protein
MKIISVRKDIKSFLKSIHPNVTIDGESKSRVHYEVAPEDAPYPFLAYILNNSTDDGTTERFVLEIDGWDNQADTTALETLMSDLDAELHRRTVMIDDNLSATYYRENRLTIKDPDAQLRRRQYVYQVRVNGDFV